MKLIFLYGMPATGKLTVARELAAITGYKLFHNHLAVDLLLSVFEFGSPGFVEAREVIWLSVFEQATRESMPGLIFTFAPEATVRASFILRAIEVIGDAGGDVDFFELTCPLAELRRRIGDASRFAYKKLTSLALFEELHAAGSFDSMAMPAPRLSVDTSLCTPARAALQIARALGGA